MINGIQVSSFKPVLTTADEVRAACAQMQAMGCRAVQLQWIDLSVPVEVIAQALKDNGLYSVSVQEIYETFLAQKDYFLRLNAATGGTWVCVSRIPARCRSLAGLQVLRDEWQALMDELAPLGMKLCFHPVSADYEPVDSVDAVAWLMEALPQLDLCLDLFHCSRMSVSMTDLLHRWQGRVCMVHFKDYTAQADGAIRLVPAGSGDICWDGVVRACMETGVRYAFVEQERWEGDPFAALAQGPALAERGSRDMTFQR